MIILTNCNPSILINLKINPYSYNSIKSRIKNILFEKYLFVKQNILIIIGLENFHGYNFTIELVKKEQYDKLIVLFSYVNF